MPDGKNPIGLDGRPAVWICTQYLDRSRFDGEEDEERRMLLGFQTLMTMLLGAGFNYSSEMHELTSGFSVSRDVDPRVSTIEAWVKASAQDPGFATSVPWLKAGYTVDEIVDRMFRRHNAFRVNARNAEDISHVVCRQHARQRLGDDKAHLLAALLGLEES
jgi:hypothetical protein